MQSVKNYFTLRNLAVFVTERSGCKLGRLSRGGRDAATYIPRRLEHERCFARMAASNDDYATKWSVCGPCTLGLFASDVFVLT